MKQGSKMESLTRLHRSSAANIVALGCKCCHVKGFLIYVRWPKVLGMARASTDFFVSS
jgi:hypothetical protein